jgi:hypothetical protein
MKSTELLFLVDTFPLGFPDYRTLKVSDDESALSIQNNKSIS